MGFQQVVYDMDQIRLNVGGFNVSRGAGASGLAADGPFLKITQSGPSFTTRRGQDGAEARSKTNNHGADVSIFTMSTNSPTNGFFSGLMTADEAAPNGASIVTLVAKDMQGTSVFIADSAYLISRPEVSFGPEASDFEWKFHAIWRLWIAGGN